MIEWAAASSVLILVVLVLRRCLMGNISLRLQYGLWALVLLRLLVPLSFGGTAISVLNLVERADIPPGAAEYAEVGTPQPSAVGPSLPLEEQVQDPQAPSRGQAEPVSPSPGTVLSAVWAAGAAGLGLWLLWVNVRFAGKLRRSRQLLETGGCPLPVYVTTAAPTPCLFGLIRPCIYVTEEVTSNDVVLRHCLAHELTHYRHGDHIWAVLRGASLALHWYNPLVWLAAVLSRRDGELCCDEAVVKRLGERERAAYGRTLLAVTCRGPAGPLLIATSMTGGRDIRQRIVLLAKRPRTASCTLAAVLLIAAAAVGCTFTGARQENAAPWEWAQDMTAERLAEENKGFDTEQLARILNDLEEADFTPDPSFSGGACILVVNDRGAQYAFTPAEESEDTWLEFEGAFWRVEYPALHAFVKKYDAPLSVQTVAFADLDRDGEAEQAVVLEMEDGLWLLEIRKQDGTELLQTAFSQSHTGWNTVYLYTDPLSGAQSLLRYSPYASTGLAAYSYTLFSLEGGKETVLEEGGVSISFDQVQEVQEELRAFAGQVNGLLQHSSLLLSTQDGALIIGPGKEGVCLEHLDGLEHF